MIHNQAIDTLNEHVSGIQLWKRFCDVKRNPNPERSPPTNIGNRRGRENQRRSVQEAGYAKFQGGRRPFYEGKLVLVQVHL